MRTIEWSTIDKSGWGDGSWQSEPDKKQWLDMATGLPCLAVRNDRGGNWCGYVGVPAGHPDHGKEYDDVDVSVHGGLSFSNGCADEVDPSRHVCHLPAPGEPDDTWWFGFDCHHFMDFAPGQQAWRERVFPNDPLFARDPKEAYRTLAYVERECADLAAQLIERGRQ